MELNTLSDKERGRKKRILSNKSICLKYKYTSDMDLARATKLYSQNEKYIKDFEYQKPNRKRILKNSGEQKMVGEQEMGENINSTHNDTQDQNIYCNTKFNKCRYIRMNTTLKAKERPKDQDYYMTTKYSTQAKRKKKCPVNGYCKVKLRANENHYENEILTGKYPHTIYDFNKYRRGLEKPMRRENYHAYGLYIKKGKRNYSPYDDPRGKGFYKEQMKDIKAENELWKYDIEYEI